jgi:hypothetical protein
MLAGGNPLSATRGRNSTLWAERIERALKVGVAYVEFETWRKAHSARQTVLRLAKRRDLDIEVVVEGQTLVIRNSPAQTQHGGTQL